MGFSAGPSPGLLGVDHRAEMEVEGTSHPSARRLEGVTHQRRCWLKVWCTTKLGPGRRRIRLEDARTVHVLHLPAGARGAARSQSSVVIPETTSTATQQAT